MCSEYSLTKPIEEIIRQMNRGPEPLRFPAGLPNLEPRPSIRITERAAIIRMDGEGPRLDMVRWSWPGPSGKPVFNFRSDGRRFETGRCIVLADAFYEYTAPADPKRKKKDKWRFTLAGHEIFGLAGLFRAGAAKGEDAWTMLTTEPGEDIAPYHDRQAVVLSRNQWAGWLSNSENEREMLAPCPAGSLEVAPVIDTPQPDLFS